MLRSAHLRAAKLDRDKEKVAEDVQAPVIVAPHYKQLFVEGNLHCELCLLLSNIRAW